MWRAHPGNLAGDAWSDLRRTLDDLLGAAGAAGVRLGIEPEPGNVVRDARAAARLLDELGHDAPIGIVLDPANLLSPETVPHQSEILAEAVDLLGPRVVGVQAKDVATSGSAAAGAGLLDYPALFRQLARLAPVPVIVQDAHERDAARVRTTCCAGTPRPAPSQNGDDPMPEARLHDASTIAVEVRVAAPRCCCRSTRGRSRAPRPRSCDGGAPTRPSAAP